MYRRHFLLSTVLYVLLFFGLPGEVLGDTSAQLEQAKRSVSGLIKSGKDAEARAAIDNLIAEFSADPNLPANLHYIARRYEKLENYEGAQAVYQQIMQYFPDSPDANNARLDIARLDIFVLIDSGQDTAVQAAIDKIIADFSENPYLPTNLGYIARRYKEAKKYEQAKSIFKKVATVFPGTDDALKAQIAIARMDVFGLMDSGNDAAAQAAIDKLIADFSGHPYLPTNLRYIAIRYKQANQYERAGDIYQQVAQHHPDSNGVTKAQLDASRMDILSFMEWGDDPNAQAAIEWLIADFNDYQRLPAVLRNFAEKYRKAKKYEEAESIYETIATDFPDTNDALRAQMAASMINILSFIDDGNDTAAMAAIDKLIADFNDQPRLPEAVFVIGEEYYNKAFQAEDEGRRSEAKPYFRKAITVFERIIQELPATTTTTYAYHLLADCYHRFGDKYCGSYVVWHTLHHYGLAKPIDIIVKEMQIEKKGSISIYEVIQALKTNGISAHAVKLKLDKVSTIDRPFIQYIAPTKSQQLGHFRLCIPTGSGKAVILDGAEEPKVIDLAFLEEHDYQETRWDGTAILIDGIEKIALQGQVSMVMNLNDLLEIASVWLETDIGDTVSLDIQLLLRAGCPDDCKDQGQNCLTVPTCESDEDCLELAGNYVCNDYTQEEKCKTPGSLPACWYDPARTCYQSRELRGNCGLESKRCNVKPRYYGDCDAATGLTKFWIYQCREGR